MRLQSGYDIQSSQKFVNSNLLTKMWCSLSVSGLRRFFIQNKFIIKIEDFILNRYACSDTLLGLRGVIE